jgi:hypothetical protein
MLNLLKWMIEPWIQYPHACVFGDLAGSWLLYWQPLFNTWELRFQQKIASDDVLLLVPHEGKKGWYDFDDRHVAL